MTLSPLTHDAFGEVSVADAYVCRWASLRVPVRSGFDVMANTRASASRCGRSAAAHASSTQALSKKRTFYELVLYWSMKFHNAGLRTSCAWCCAAF